MTLKIPPTSNLIFTFLAKHSLHKVNSTLAFVGFFLSIISTLLCLDIIISFLGLYPKLWQCLECRKISFRGQFGPKVPSGEAGSLA